jgi:hypothetical protein
MKDVFGRIGFGDQFPEYKEAYRFSSGGSVVEACLTTRPVQYSHRDVTKRKSAGWPISTSLLIFMVENALQRENFHRLSKNSVSAAHSSRPTPLPSLDSVLENLA